MSKSNFIYKNGQLAYILMPEGRLLPQGSGFAYEYHLRDHLGNTRVTYTAGANGSTAISQNTAYYPFGLPINALSRNTESNPYLYNGKELHSELKMDLFDYGARFYDAEVGRFHTIDRFAEKYGSLSPYSYVAGNPIRNIDVNGDSIIVLSAANSVGGLGHAAVLIGNNDNGWRLYSKNGTTWLGGASGPSNKHPEIGVEFNSLEEFANSFSNFTETGDVLYTEGFLIASNSEIDVLMEDAATESIESYYNVSSNSCIDVPSATLDAVGLDPGYKTFPQINAGGVPTETKSLSPIPNIRYEQIKKNNVGKVIKSELIPNSATREEMKRSADARKNANEQKARNNQKQKAIYMDYLRTY